MVQIAGLLYDGTVASPVRVVNSRVLLRILIKLWLWFLLRKITTRETYLSGIILLTRFYLEWFLRLDRVYSARPLFREKLKSCPE